LDSGSPRTLRPAAFRRRGERNAKRRSCAELNDSVEGLFPTSEYGEPAVKGKQQSDGIGVTALLSVYANEIRGADLLKSPSHVIPSEARNLHLLVFNEIHSDASLRSEFVIFFDF